jgi:CRP/FNR family transcriptional regulator, cyclic AMP receptor protein
MVCGTMSRWSFIMATLVAASRFLRFLEPEEENALLAAASPRSFERNEVVLDQDVPLRAIYLIEEGSVRVERQGRERSTPLAILGAGEFFGEMSFVDGAPTSARVLADEPTRIRVIDEQTVENQAHRDASFAGRLYRSIAAILVERLRLTSMHLSLDRSWS